MVDRIGIAKKFILEQIKKRDDMVGAIVTGSVSRGEEVESSDIDISLIVDGEIEGYQRGGVDTWQDGVYIDAITVSKENYADFEKVLQDPFRATHMNDGLIIYDPARFLTQIQKEVQAVFMEPKWVGIRVQYWLEKAQGNMSKLQESVSAGDSLGICVHGRGIRFGVTFAPLLRIGIAPNSLRALGQLGKTSGKLKERICEWDGSTKMSKDDVLGLLPVVSEGISLLDKSENGHLPEYALKKVEWLTKNGLHQEALHLMWIGMSLCAGLGRRHADPLLRSKATELVQSWLEGVGWEGQEVLEEKFKMAESIVGEVEALASDLPSTSV